MTRLDADSESVEQENERLRAELAAALARIAADGCQNEVLPQSEEKYRSLHETRIEAFVRVDMSGRILEFNDAYRQMLGYESEELLTLSYQQITPAKWHAFEADIIERQVLARGHSDIYEKDYQRKDGTVFPVELRTILIREADGAPSGMWAIVRDITDRKRGEQALRDSESWLMSAMQVAAIGLYRQVGPSDNRSTFLDARARALLGIPHDQEYRTHAYWIEHLHPDDLPRVAEVSRTFETGGASRAVVEYRYVRNNNEIVWIRHVAEAPERDAQGRAILVIGILENITERKRAEDEMQQVRLQLWHADRVAQTGALTASLSHELKQPLTAILANAQAGLRLLNCKNPDVREIGEILTDIINDNKRATAVISGLRELLRRKETQRAEINLRDTVRESLDLLRSELSRQQLVPRLGFESDYMVLADKTQIQQVVINLVINAIEAMDDQPAGQRKLGLSLTHTDAGEALVAVRDSGTGISEEQRQKLFESFWTTKPKGMGIGLHISRSIVQSHGGRLWFEKNPDRGVTFFFTLPIATTHAPRS